MGPYRKSRFSSKRWRARALRWRCWLDRPFEHLLNVRTPPDLGPGGKRGSLGDGTCHVPFPYLMLPYLMSPLRISATDVVFDVGAGAGRVVCYLARRPIRKVVGVELMPDLAERASRNLATLRGRRAETEIICTDAALADYSGGTVYTFYYPFGPETLEAVLGRIRSSLTDGRTIRLAFFDVEEEHREVLASCGWLWCYARREPPFYMTNGAYWTSSPSPDQARLGVR